jgi:hypothetical protein
MVLRNLLSMPGFVKTPKDEARWSKAKEAAGKSTSKDSKSYWKLSNYIYHKMGKSETDAAEADKAYNDMDDLEKASARNYSNFEAMDKHERQSIKGNEVTQMSDEKKYSAQEAATAVLKKAEEMLKSSKLFKSGEIPHTAAATPEEAPADGVKAEPNAPAEVPRNGNPEWGTDPAIKGHVKLAKFCGMVESKRKKPAAPGV